MLTATEIHAFQRDGFLVVDRPIMPASYLDRIEQTIAERAPTRTDDHAVDEWIGLLRTSEALQPAVDVTRAIAIQLLGTRRPACHFDHALVKPPKPGSEIAWHQDMASSKTKAFGRSVHLWIPLHDVAVENGCLRYARSPEPRALLPHRMLGEGRYEVIEPELSDVVDAAVKRGGLAIHSPLTIHGSEANLSGQPRSAWIIQFGAGIAPKLRERLRTPGTSIPHRASGRAAARAATGVGALGVHDPR